jgi:hypothetical protein
LRSKSKDASGKIPTDLDTFSCAGPVTQAFTGRAILILRDDGLLALDEPLERSVPEVSALRYPTLDSPRITLRHLLTWMANSSRSDCTTATVIWAAACLLSFFPRAARWTYPTAFVMLAGYALFTSG